MGRLSMLLKHFLHNEKPRERFFKYGPSSLSNHELVAILLRNCTKNLFFNYSQDFCNYLAVNMSFVYKRARRNCVVMEEVRFLTHEYFVCLYLNTKNQVLHKHTVFIGSLNSSIVHPREIFKEAFKRSAASFICVHNHPSGDPTPSREDIEVTQRLFECGKLIGIQLLDHLVIGDQKFVSLKEKGYL